MPVPDRGWALASQYEQLGLIGEPDLVGVDAALIILRELVAEANRMAVDYGQEAFEARDPTS